MIWISLILLLIVSIAFAMWNTRRMEGGTWDRQVDEGERPAPYKVEPE